MSLNPSVQHFFDRFPATPAAYAETNLYHLTHSRYIPSIQVNGLRPQSALFSADQGAFLIDMLHQYGSADPGECAYVQDRILDPSTVYLSTTEPDMERPLGYGIPERLMLLMRGMASLAVKASLTDAQRQFAVLALEEHRRALTEDNPAIVALRIDPLAPGIVNSRFGKFNLERVSDTETALEVARYVDGPYANNIRIQHEIEPEYITIWGKTPISPERAMQGVYAEPSWTTSIR